MKLTKSQLALLIEHYLEEGFFDLKDLPVLRRLGDLNESVSHSIFERVKQRLKV